MFVVSASVGAALWFAPIVSAQDKTANAQDKTVSGQDKNATTQDRSVSAPDRNVSTRDKTVSTQDKTVSTRDNTGSTVNVTGCLAQGDEKNEYAIKDADGKTYGLKAGSELNLKSHLGHKMTVTGTPIEKKEKVKPGKAEESEHLRVSNFSMISTSCS